MTAGILARPARDAPSFEREEALSAADALAAEIHARITGGQLAPGQRLVENDLTADLGASRGSIREALRLLAAQGIVRIEMHRGARVRRFSRAECLALIEVRQALEGLAARLAAERATPDDVAILRGINGEADAAASREAVADYLSANDRLHEAVIAAAGNGMIRSHLFLAQLALFRVQTRFLRANDLSAAQAEHAEIIARIAAGDADGAERAMRSHIGATRTGVLVAPPRLFEPD